MTLVILTALVISLTNPSNHLRSLSYIGCCFVCYQDGCTPAYNSAWEGHTDILQALIKARADLNKKTVICRNITNVMVIRTLLVIRILGLLGLMK